ncbi:Fructosamine kinase [Rubripirellula lacrimiformis]|uniref:Fructosamine kinase n=1 Tax=Rubripirellula lacrimiformis TaxID=1930273 RepID=A0A517NLD1_9BACT|nr:fructosamine kinase family protein [Rubripirellula lacrimiformis]QDT07944.1 Fructosamine kinase [Rubripirellula lacrimiformis]
MTTPKVGRPFQAVTSNRNTDGLERPSYLTNAYAPLLKGIMMDSVADAVLGLVPGTASVVNVAAVGGGCISDAYRVDVRCDDGSTQCLFVKGNDESFADNFACERAGLTLLHDAASLVIPRPIADGIVNGRAWLVIEWVESGPRPRSFFADLGRGLAELHRSTLGTEIGLDHDNYLGAARQINGPSTTWPSFVAQHRIGFQLRWAVDQGLADSTLRRDVGRIIDAMDDLLAGRQDPTSLLHGDLWSGNILCDQRGRPVIVDPAVYRGCREAELGMLKLFGACPADFYEAYDQAFPLSAGWQRRTSVYVLYHLLNHLNLFGVGYLDQCRSQAADLLS